MEIHSIQTITVSLVIGIFSYVVARSLKVPAVLFYLFGGIIAGPVGFGVIDSKALGTGLLTLVEIAVAIILFEGDSP
jgi:NhaP-type Na+/H+ or K+/H+ antiporter